MVTFQDDPVGPKTSKFGEDNYMWASDFPHSDCTWPNSRKVIDSGFGGVSPTESRQDSLRQRRASHGIEIDGGRQV